METSPYVLPDTSSSSPTVFINIGAMGCGKTTATTSYATQHNLTVLGSDVFIELISSKCQLDYNSLFKPENKDILNLAFTCHDKCYKYLTDNRKSFIWDRCNLNPTFTIKALVAKGYQRKGIVGVLFEPFPSDSWEDFDQLVNNSRKGKYIPKEVWEPNHKRHKELWSLGSSGLVDVFGFGEVRLVSPCIHSNGDQKENGNGN